MTQAELITAVETALTGAGLTVAGSDPITPPGAATTVKLEFAWGANMRSGATVHNDRLKLTVEAGQVASQSSNEIQTTLAARMQTATDALLASTALRGAAVHIESYPDVGRKKTGLIQECRVAFRRYGV